MSKERVAKGQSDTFLGIEKKKWKEFAVKGGVGLALIAFGFSFLASALR